ncbi:TIR-only protein-like [Oryza brachyantha]|uniref:TIR domain-containing protein n=1 Tax=Oryza brachyantha TaxID=4533 RepID=J3MM46_ORYBR|nr:TIR-only protein-like [Oryza brachyantha]
MSSYRLSSQSQRRVASRLSASAEVAVGASGSGSSKGRKKKAPVARRGVQYYDDDEAAPGQAAAPFDCFINHRGADTKRTVARLLYELLEDGGVHAFLDNKSMRPGDRLEERIGAAIGECSVAVAIFSRHYCDSEYCLRELAMLVESRKTIIPIFFDIKPSDLILPQALVDNVAHPRDIERFKFALREAKNTVGLTYDPATGDLAELVSDAARAVMENIDRQEITQGRQMVMSRL